MCLHKLLPIGCALVWCGLLLVLPVQFVNAQTPQLIAKKAFGSTLLLIMADDRGQPVSLGSGFLVRNDVIATNLHVVKGASHGSAKLVGSKTKSEITGIVAVDSDRDLVLLKISASQGVPVVLGNSETVQVGEPVYAVGNPQGLEGTFSQGIVSSIREVGADKLLQITAPISPGSSGGPVLNSKGEVIGVSAATFMGGQNLNFAIPSNYVRSLLPKIGPARDFSGVIPASKQQSILGDLEGRNTEGATGGVLRWSNSTGGRYTFSLRNQLNQNIKNVACLVVFRDQRGNPIDTDFVHYRGIIAAGLAKRVESQVDQSVRSLTTLQDYMGGWIEIPRTKIEFRILDFQLSD